MSFDRAQSLRRIKPQRNAAPLIRRGDPDLPLVGRPEPGPELLLDTCVYLDVLRGKTPVDVDELLRLRIVNHSTVALAELTHLYGRLDPNQAGTRAVLSAISAVIDDVPAHRSTSPSARIFGEAGMLAGLVTRLSGRSTGSYILSDALLFLQAREMGCALLTANLSEFDLFDQVLPGSGLLLYRTTL